MSLDATCSTCVRNGEGTYWMRATCGNCQREFDVELSKGHEAYRSRPDCTFCGVDDMWAWTPIETAVRP